MHKYSFMHASILLRGIGTLARETTRENVCSFWLIEVYSIRKELAPEEQIHSF